MEKLELKHLAPYLPYSLEVLTNKNNKGFLSFNYDEKHHYHKLTIGYVLQQELKPILKPLSEISDEQIKELKENHPNCPNFFSLFNPPHVWEYHRKNISNSFIEYAIFDKLCQWHFDVFGLIPKGLAIDKNTLEESD